MVYKTINPELAKLLAHWKGKEGNLIMILHEIQNHHGYVPRELSLELSKMLDVPLARIYEVITFYNFFKLSPPGKHRIALCMGTACYLRGAAAVLTEIKNILGIGRRPDHQRRALSSGCSQVFRLLRVGSGNDDR